MLDDLDGLRTSCRFEDPRVEPAAAASGFVNGGRPPSKCGELGFGGDLAFPALAIDGGEGVLLSDADLSKRVTMFADVPTTGGTAIAADGTIYMSDTDHNRIFTVSPEGTMQTLIEDPRLD